MRHVGRVAFSVLISLLVGLGSVALVVLAQLDAFTRSESCMPQVDIVLDVGSQTTTSISPACLRMAPDPVALTALGTAGALMTAGLLALTEQKLNGRRHVSRTTTVP